MMEQLTKREEEVMNKFWEKGEATVKEIIATYPEPRPSRTAISTFVKFLVDKGFFRPQAGRKQRIHLLSPYRKRGVLW